MSRLLSLLIAVALVAANCSGTADVQDAQAASPEAIGAQTNSELAEQPDEAVTLLLPDPERWVVVEDWARAGASTTWPEDDDSLQLDFAPLDEAGVPQLGRRISLSYRLGEEGERDRQWGDSGGPDITTEFETSVGPARSVSHDGIGVSITQVQSEGTFVYAQSMDPDADLVELAKSLTKVDQATWSAARSGADSQRLIAVEAAMQDIDIVESAEEPLPHWIFPEPWEVQWVTDMTIWTPEQRAQRDALGQANQRPVDRSVIPDAFRSWFFGYVEDTDEPTEPFVPQIMLTVLVFDEATSSNFPLNYETFSALGMQGVISGSTVELESGNVRVFGSMSGLSRERIRELFDSIAFATDDPLDGFVANDPRFRQLDLDVHDEQLPSWHAAWENPEGGPTGHISVWRLGVSELRQWLFSRGSGMAIPDDSWETIAADGVINFGNQTAYDASTGLLRTLRGIDASELIPIELDDWIAFAEPVNSDPLNPR